ncbi:LapA family protein [Saccharomonospora piscinae]|uniref:LapA family protein n=1 Tax=Saccharomonospora piscinae TaxID=687388 RepID=UPI0004643808|nr:lipopolysaccharide assembly protein LapA domain-containing protein [Saccharomonospora piscinae]
MSTPAEGATPGANGGPTRSPKVNRTRISGLWVGVSVAAVLLALLLVFILQNTDPVTVHFLGTRASLPLGVSMLLSAVAGALVVAALGAARILQLRRTVRKTGGGRRDTR